jgi:hypothetical protein
LISVRVLLEGVASFAARIEAFRLAVYGARYGVAEGEDSRPLLATLTTHVEELAAEARDLAAEAQAVLARVRT